MRRTEIGQSALVRIGLNSVSQTKSNMTRNKYLGSWKEPESHRIQLPFTTESARQVLRWGLEVSSASVTHQDIAHWCDRFCRTFRDVDATTEIESLLPTMTDVDCQWELYLANTYSLSQLQNLDFSKVELPRDWFSKWLSAIDPKHEAG